MKNVIVISYHFAPEEIIASKRFTYITEYLLLKDDYSISLITARGAGTKYPTKDYYYKLGFKSVEFIEESRIKSFYRRLKRIIKKRFYTCNKKKPRSFDSNINTNSNYGKFIRLIFDSLNYFSEIIFEYLEFIRFIYFNKHGMNYDVLISTFGPQIPHMIAKYYKKKEPKSYWIADFRDPIFNSSTPIPFRNYAKNRAKILVGSADSIVAVSRTMMNNLFLNHNQIVHIPNGFKRATSLLERKVDAQYKFAITYAGTLYKNSALSLLMKSIDIGLNLNQWNSLVFEFNYAGLSHDILEHYLGSTSPNIDIINHGVLKSHELNRIYSKTNLAIVLNWNNEYDKGLISGKIYEILSLRIPYLIIVDGDPAGNEELDHLISICGGGLVLYTSDDCITNKINNYITDLINERIIHFNNEIIDLYSYDKISNDYYKLIESLINSND
jgi:hypothetical protein